MAANWKKIGKISLIVLGVLLLVVASFIGYLYYQYQGKYPVDHEKYSHDVGYLSPENNDYNVAFERCSDKRPIGYYSSALDYKFISFKGGKRSFVRFIQQNIPDSTYTDTGFLNLRFIINCKGDLGNFEVNELDENLQVTTLNKELVDQLIQLTVRKENWQVPKLEEPRDRYMYLIYKIENGAISEILP